VSVRRLAIAAIVLQALFSIAWLVAGGLDEGYSHERQYVSELGARDAEHAWIFIIGAFALGLSWVATGLALRLALPKRPWSWAPPALFVASGIAAGSVALLPLDCSVTVDDACRARAEDWDLAWRHYAHGLVGLGAQLMLAATPFALALALRPGQLARVALALGIIGLALGAALLAVPSVDEDRDGIYQRAGLAVVQGWTCLLAAALLLVATVRPPGAVAPR
jgi:hypothetical protein